MRALSFISLLFLGFLAPWWCFLPVAALYGLRYRAYELPALGVLLDGASGAGFVFATIPYAYTLMTFAVALLGDMLRPHIRFFGTRDVTLARTDRL